MVQGGGTPPGHGERKMKFNPLHHLRLLGMLFKEFKLLVRRKKTPILVLSLPLILLIVYSAGSNAITNPQAVITVGVCSEDPQTSEILNMMEGNFKLTKLEGDDCIAQLMTGVKAGDYIIGFVIPSDFTTKLNQGDQSMITYYVDDSNPLTASMSGFFLEQGFNTYSRGVVSSSEQELRSIARDTRTKLNSTILVLNTTYSVLESNKGLLGLTYPIISEYLSDSINELIGYDDDLRFVEGISVDFLTKPVYFAKGTTYENVNSASFNFASIFCIVSIFSLLLLTSTSIIFDKKTNYLLRIKATGTFIPTYTVSKIIFYLILSLAQFFLIMLLMLPQGAVFNFSFGALMAAFAMITITNTSIGLLIGSLSESENVAILFSLTLSLPFLFLSGAFFPLEFMPGYVKFFARVIPLHSEISLLKQASVLGWNLEMINPLITELGLISLILLGINYAIIKFKS